MGESKNPREIGKEGQTMKNYSILAIVFLALTTVFLVVLCIAVPIGIAYSGGKTAAVNGSDDAVANITDYRQRMRARFDKGSAFGNGGDEGDTSSLSSSPCSIGLYKTLQDSRTKDEEG